MSLEEHHNTVSKFSSYENRKGILTISSEDYFGLCKCHLSDTNYRFSDNLPRSQALLEDQLSRITWRDIMFLFRSTVSLIYLALFFAPRQDMQEKRQVTWEKMKPRE